MNNRVAPVELRSNMDYFLYNLNFKYFLAAKVKLCTVRKKIDWSLKLLPIDKIYSTMATICPSNDGVTAGRSCYYILNVAYWNLKTTIQTYLPLFFLVVYYLFIYCVHILDPNRQTKMSVPCKTVLAFEREKNFKDIGPSQARDIEVLENLKLTLVTLSSLLCWWVAWWTSPSTGRQPCQL